MRALLIRPSNPSESAYLTKWGFLPAPLGLLQLAGELLSSGDNEVRVLDMEADVAGIEQVMDIVNTYRPELIGITIHATAAYSTSCRIARLVKSLFPETVMVAGGHHATFVPNQLLREGFDIVVLGEGDFTLADIVRTLESIV